MADIRPKQHSWMGAAFALTVLLAALAGCTNPERHFVPGVSPTTTPFYNDQGVISAPIVITDDLPDSWRWQFVEINISPGNTFKGWSLFDQRNALRAAVDEWGGCWVVLGVIGHTTYYPEECLSKGEIGKIALKLALNGDPDCIKAAEEAGLSSQFIEQLKSQGDLNTTAKRRALRDALAQAELNESCG